MGHLLLLLRGSSTGNSNCRLCQSPSACLPACLPLSPHHSSPACQAWPELNKFIKNSSLCAHHADLAQLPRRAAAHRRWRRRALPLATVLHLVGVAVVFLLPCGQWSASVHSLSPLSSARIRCAALQSNLCIIITIFLLHVPSHCLHCAAVHFLQCQGKQSQSRRRAWPEPRRGRELRDRIQAHTLSRCICILFWKALQSTWSWQLPGDSLRHHGHSCTPPLAFLLRKLERLCW